MKRKGSIGGNPNPVQTPEFLAKQFPPAPDIPPNVKLGEPVAVALPLPIDTEVRRLKNRSIWLRRVITEAAQRELMNAPQGDRPNVADVNAEESPGTTRQTRKSKTKAQPTVEESSTSETTPKRRGRPRKKPVEG